MTTSTQIQAFASAVFILLAVAFLNPFHLLMTDMFHMLILGLAAAALGVFSILIMRERGGDEREAAHRMLAGRAAFLAGAAILLAGIVWQAFAGVVDPWLVMGLCGMVFAKVSARIYGELML